MPLTPRTRTTALITAALLMLCAVASTNSTSPCHLYPDIWVSVGTYELLAIAIEWILFQALFRLGWFLSLKIALAASLASFCVGLLPSLFVDEWGAAMFYMLVALPLDVVIAGLTWRSMGKLQSSRCFWLNIIWVSALVWFMGFYILPLCQASVRSPVSRVKSDMRCMATAIESYYVDHNCYPPARPLREACKSFHDVGRLRRAGGYDLATIEFGRLTTPVSYVTENFPDTLAPVKGLPFVYYADINGWILVSAGPDKHYDLNPATLYDSMIPQPSTPLITGATFDPTNGTDSRGDVWRVKQ